MPNGIKIILLDVDGVLADFRGAAARLFKCDRERMISFGENVSSDVVAFLAKEWDYDYDSAKKRMWEGIHTAGAVFWRGIDMLPWAPKVIHICLNYVQSPRLLFCTSPSNASSSVAGKLDWLLDHQEKLGLDRIHGQYVLTRQKHLLSQPGTVLIDDYSRNIEDFKRAGPGAGVLFPRFYNSGRKLLTKTQHGFEDHGNALNHLLFFANDEMMGSSHNV